MAIYALAIKHKAKGKGASAVAHAQYIAREGKYGEKKIEQAKSHAEYLTRQGKHERRRDELEKTWSGNMPAWAKTPGEFWEAADTYERANGRVYTEVVIALPRELSKDGREKVVNDFVEKEIGDRFSYTVAIHNPRALDGGEQPHAHIMFSIRERDGIERPKQFYFRRANPEEPEKGGAKKSREWSRDSRENDRINEIRASWETLANKALEKEGQSERIDRRSLKDQGIDREPEPKMGPAVTQRLKRGQRTEIGEKVIELRNYRKREKEIMELENELKREKGKVYDFNSEKEKLTELNQGEFLFYGERREVSPEERDKYRRTVDIAFTRHERDDGNTDFRWKNSGKVAFTDKGDRISFNSTNQTAIKAGLQVAKEKGWDSVIAKGSEEFRRDSWLQGQLMGMEVKGFDPTKADFDRLSGLKMEEALKKETLREKDTKAQKDRGEEPLRDSTQDKETTTRMKASDVVKEFDKEVKTLLKERDSLEGKEKGEEGRRISEINSRLDSLYRDKHDLKKLGDTEIRVEKNKDGSFEVGDRRDMKRQVRELDQKQQKERGRGPSRGR